ncbi:hypothetical protein AB1Y20_018815 [Prymnesium parvum]|uniref:RNA helicase n=1 Tax=Prymnesium parvum TaxID=97485 RepID=A0AB34JPR7_PRYPA
MKKRKADALPHELRRSIDAARQELPIWAVRRAILEEVATSATLVLTGETGCGKTTQIPQFLLAAGYDARGIIAVTQPRRVAAMSVARRVAEEMAVEVGSRVGYSVRFDDCTSQATRIIYMTDGMLLRAAMQDPLLSRFSVLVVDEAHERSLQTDMILSIAKSVQAIRGGAHAAGGVGGAAVGSSAGALKLLVMSATLETDTFCEYFGCDRGPVQVQGRQHPVSLFYTSSPQDDYVEAAVTATLQLHMESLPGDILVFLTGQEDIEAAGHAIQQRAAVLPPEMDALEVHPLYAALPAPLQMAALDPPPAKTRKVILATNIAETSLTIEGVVYVIDAGLVKQRTYHPGKKIDSLLATPISKAAARQRAGRAGRQQPGECYRLYTEQTFRDLDATSRPEILRTSLASTILSLKALKVVDVLAFDFLSPPPRASIIAALEQLLALGALLPDGAISSEGEQMARLPLEPSYAKALLVAGEQGCCEQMLSLVAMLATDGSLFHSTSATRDAADDAKRRFTSPQGDTITMVNVFSSFGRKKGSTARAWCQKNFVNRRTVESAIQIRDQLRTSAIDLGLLKADDSFERDGGLAKSPVLDAAPVGNEMGRKLRRCLTAAFFMQAAQRQPNGEYLALSSRQVVSIHPSSVLFHRRATCVIFNELLFTSRLYMRDLTQIEADWLVELAPQYYASRSGLGSPG